MQFFKNRRSISKPHISSSIMNVELMSMWTNCQVHNEIFWLVFVYVLVPIQAMYWFRNAIKRYHCDCIIPTVCMTELESIIDNYVLCINLCVCVSAYYMCIISVIVSAIITTQTIRHAVYEQIHCIYNQVYKCRVLTTVRILVSVL